KSAILPSLVGSAEELVRANSRLALVALIGASVGGLPALGVQELFGSDWSLRMAALVFVIATIVAAKIPKLRPIPEPDTRQTQLERAELHEPTILLAGSAMALLRGSVGFLSFFTAFSLKDDLFGLGVVLTASVMGAYVGVIAAPVLRRAFRE